MLFNSFVFIFAFLPISLIVYYAIGQHDIKWHQTWNPICKPGG